MTRRIEPLASPPRDASMEVPGSRSITNRALVCAALAEGTSRLRGWLDADDTEAMRDGIAAFGASVRVEDGDLVVAGVAGRVRPPREAIDCRLSGSTIRFLTAVASLVDGWVTLDGLPPLRKRPIGPLVDALDALHVKVSSSDGFPPVSVCGPLQGGHVALDASASGQSLSGLLLAGPATRDGLRIEVGPVASEPFVEMTRRVMESFGVRTARLWSTNDAAAPDRASYIVRPAPYRATDYEIEPDAMSASYAFAAAAVTGGSIVVPGLRRDSMQGDVAILGVLEAMGCRVTEADEGVVVTGGALRGTTADLRAMPDMAPTLAVVACFASSPTTLTGVRHLRIKESDRMAALQAELTKLGAEVTVAEDEMTIEPPSTVRPASIRTYDDHRIAMAFAVAGLVVDGIEIQDPGVVAKTFPRFYEALDALR